MNWAANFPKLLGFVNKRKKKISENPHVKAYPEEEFLDQFWESGETFGPSPASG